MKWKLLTGLAMLVLPGLAIALGLGKLQLNSALNQPFDARIELLAASADELDSLKVGLADSEAFRRAKIHRPFVLGKLKFEVVEPESGPDYIRISSRDAIREPFLNFLLEANWSTGRLYREYTVLLDPPLYDPGVRRPAPADTSTPSMVSDERYAADVAEEAPAAPVLSYGADEYGPTDSSDTLWSIASRVRPDASVSVQQMMLALLRTNPEAFINGNINGLKRGRILDIPPRDEIEALSVPQAVAEVRAQNADWPGVAAMASDTPGERPDSMAPGDERGSAVAGDTGAGPGGAGEDAELRLLAADSSGEGGSEGVGDSDSGASVELALANEQLEALDRENTDLRERMAEAETIIEDLKRLIELKDDELAALQQQMAAGGAQQAPEEVPTADAADIFEDTGEPVMEDEMTAEEPVVEAEAMEDTGMEQAAGEEEVDTVAGEATEPRPAPAADTPPAGLVDRALAFVMGNLVLIAGALAGLVVVIGLLLFLSKRRQGAASEAAATPATPEFPDFDEAEAATEVAAEEGAAATDMEMEVGPEDDTVLPAGEKEAGEAAEFATPETAPQPEEAAAPEAEAAPAQEPEEEPLAEVNVLIAYEQFDQAEEFVRDAISGDPENIEFHAKLLEVFYAANDRKKYEEAARVLHEKVNGAGPHWEMAVAMWQEMSPSRALFEEGAEEPEEAAAPEAERAGGIMDITADDEDADGAAGIDFDLGMEAEPGADAEAPVEEASGGGEDVLDITAADEEEDVSVLDVTTAATVDESTSDEDLLDVTAAVGLEDEEPAEESADEAGDEEQVLDITAGPEGSETAGAADEDVLDISHGGDEDLLDVTANANLESGDMEEDLLDVTSNVGADADGEELLEVPSEEEAPAQDDHSLDFDIGGLESEDDTEEKAEAAGGEPSEEDHSLDFDSTGLEFEAESPEETAEAPGEESPEDDNSLDFDITGLGSDAESPEDKAESPREESPEEDNSLDFDMGAPESGEQASEPGSGEEEEEIHLELDDGSTAEADADTGGIELELDAGDTDQAEEAPAAAEDSGVEFDLSLEEEGPEKETTGGSLGDTGELGSSDSGDSSDGDLEIDLSIDDEPATQDDASPGSGDLEMELTLDDDDSDAGAETGREEDLEIDLDLEIQDDGSQEVPEIDMEGTVEMPRLDTAEAGIEIDDDDEEDDEEDHTVFVPRSGAAEEQTAEDEIATKLDLAKAYVELGDKDSAKGVLDEVMAEGNDEQKQAAQALLEQLG